MLSFVRKARSVTGLGIGFPTTRLARRRTQSAAEAQRLGKPRAQQTTGPSLLGIERRSKPEKIRAKRSGA